jgi:hypothetical protein
MDTGTLIEVVAMIDRKIDQINKEKKSIDASGYSVLSKRLALDRLIGASQALEELSNYLQKGIEAGVSKAEDALGAGE